MTRAEEMNTVEMNAKTENDMVKTYDEINDDELEQVAGGKYVDKCIKTVVDFALKPKTKKK
ncbi:MULTISPECIES: bacteriocin class II family protein [unclassified Butyrivibrio]|uniref:bacteriocin class II family protein n=1 Tax=unclassified Butyrivibrio TaxID=2639466 RepID=UPI000415BE98|nr:MULTISPECIES: bacteriocin class II family protein [unclassified Butyrivibrio]